MAGTLPTKSGVTAFLQLPERDAVALALKWKALMLSGYGRSKPLAEATINRRLAALKSLVVMGANLGVCNFNLARVKGEKVVNTATRRELTEPLLSEFWERVIGQH
jgi:integrase/recombinase XerC